MPFQPGNICHRKIPYFAFIQSIRRHNCLEDVHSRVETYNFAIFEYSPLKPTKKVLCQQLCVYLFESPKISKSIFVEEEEEKEKEKQEQKGDLSIL